MHSSFGNTRMEKVFDNKTLEWSLCCAIENKRTDSEIKDGQKYHFLNLQEKTKDVMNLNTLGFTDEGNCKILELNDNPF